MNDLSETSRRWWRETKSDPAALLAWLHDQHRGESRAAGRIRALRDAFAAPGTRPHRLLTKIAAQEEKHAGWVAALLEARGERARSSNAADRYWPHVTALVSDLATGAAVGAHAESMRLARIVAIAGDAAAPPDVRDVFRRILPEERFHERAFRSLAGGRADALARTAGGHALGLAALGLSP